MQVKYQTSFYFSNNLMQKTNNSYNIQNILTHPRAKFSFVKHNTFTEETI